MLNRQFFEAVATYVGFSVGAGILGIPFVVEKSGFFIGLFDIILIGIIFMFLHLYLGEIVLRTAGSHQLTGYADIYLGRKGKWLMAFSLLFGMTGALTAYIVKQGEFLNILLQPSFGGSHMFYSTIIFLALGYIVYKGLEAVERSELYMVAVVLAVVVILALIGLPHVQLSNLAGFNPSMFFLPFGVIMFSFLATGSIPEMREELANHTNLMKKAIVAGAVIVLIVYMLFAFVVVGVSGSEVTDGAVTSLGKFLGNNVMLLGIVFGILTMSTAFIAVSLALKEAYMFDYGISSRASFLLACGIPYFIALLVVMSNVSNAFFRILSITGIITGSLVGFLIVPMIWRAKKLGDRKPEYTVADNRFIEYSILVIFLLGIIFEFVRILF